MGTSKFPDNSEKACHFDFSNGSAFSELSGNFEVPIKA